MNSLKKTVHHFAKLSPTKLEKVKSALGLTMSQGALQMCARYFRTYEPKRDPSVEELLLLDKLSQIPTPAYDSPITDLYTNDDFVAETYADMMQKRRELRPGARRPICAGEALLLATKYLERSGKKIDRETPVAVVNRMNLTAGNRLGELYANGSDFSICALPKNGEADPQVGDRFILVYRGSMPMWKYRKEIDGLLSQESVRASARMIRRIPDGGFLSMLISLQKGLAINLTQPLPDGTEPSLASLGGDRFAEYACILAPKSAVKELEEKIRACGMRPYVAATVTEGDRVEFVFARDHVISFAAPFLRRLRALSPKVAILPDEDTEPSARVCTLSAAKGSAYLRDCHSAQRASLEDLTVTAAVSTSSSPFRSALYATVASVLSAVASGAEREDLQLAIGVKYPKMEANEKAFGVLISGILGIYRAQTELAIPACDVTFLEDDTLSEPEFTVFCLGKYKEIPDRATKKDGTLFCTIPTIQPNGLPNFDALRFLITALTEQSGKGAIQGARVICREAFSNALSGYTGENTVCQADGHLLFSEEILPLTLLLESDSALPFAYLGALKAKESRPTVQAPWIGGNLLSNLNRGERTEVVLIAGPTDADAYALADYIRSLGADATVLSPDDPTLVHSILCAQMLILCRGIGEPEDQRVCFACEAMDLAGGIILSLDKSVSFDEDFPILTLEGGLSAENLKSLLEL